MALLALPVIVLLAVLVVARTKGSVKTRLAVRKRIANTMATTVLRAVALSPYPATAIAVPVAVYTKLQVL